MSSDSLKNVNIKVYTKNNIYKEELSLNNH